MTMDTASRTNRCLPATILTSGYLMIGKLTVTSTGVIAMLNDSTRSAADRHLIPNLHVESAGILVNRRQIDLVVMLNQRVKQES